MAATTVSDFYLPYVNPSADQDTQMRVSKQATVAWGIVQLLVASGAQFMNRSVLDAGLAVLSFASGSVLGAFLLGTLAPSVRERDTFAGMIAGLIVMTLVWWATPIAFTWYVLIGAVTTCAVAMVSRTIAPQPT
jgi:Na+/proline symporter